MAMPKEVAAQIKADLATVVKECGEVAGVPVNLTKADVLSSQVRQTITSVLAALDPEGYEKYRAIKYGEGGEVVNPNPSLKDRQAAYRFAFNRFLKLTYRHAGF